LPAYEVGRRLGLRIVAVDKNPAAPGMELADVAHPIDTRDAEGVLAIARRERIDGLVTLCTDLPVRTVAYVARALGLPALSPEAAALATDKGKMREAFLAAGAPSPRFRRVRTLAEATAAFAAVGAPAIMKPVSSSGSRGVTKLTTAADLAAAFAHATGVDGNAEVVVEEFVEGPEVSVETISHRGRHTVVTITDKRTTGDPHWVEMGHVEPSRLPGDVQEDIRNATVRGLAALGIDEAAGHVEVKAGPRGARLVEIGARLGGDFITTELTVRSTGVDMTEAVIRIALGEEPDLRHTRSIGAAVRFLAPPPGRVTRVSGAEEARAMPGVVRLEVDVAAGSTVPVVRSSLDRAGFVICEGGGAGEAEARAEAAAARIHIETETTS
jgi:biotin carboxylase